MKPQIALIWAGALFAAFGAFVPNLYAWLARALGASQRIERYTAEILESTDAIVANTARGSGLKQTIAAAPRLLSTADSLERHTSAIRASVGQAERDEVADREEGQ
jgi:hypothetical protein